MNAWAKLWLLATVVIIACGTEDGGSSAPQTTPSSDAGRDAPRVGAQGLAVQFGSDVDPLVRERVLALLAKAGSRPVPEISNDASSAGAYAHVVTFGTTALQQRVKDKQVAPLDVEEYAITTHSYEGAEITVVEGGAAACSKHCPTGLSYGSYELLRQLGIRFLHPLRPTLPEQLQVDKIRSVRSKPYWKDRGIHLHTLHPLELTEFLNGFGTGGETDSASFESTFAAWDNFLDWCLANKINRMDWVLLESASWQAFSRSALRAERLGRVIARAHAFGVRVGVGTPMAQAQQNSFRLIRNDGSLEQQLAELRTSVAWIFGLGVDFISSAAGKSEFVHSDPTTQLAWMNELVRVAHDVHGGEAFVGAHCSTGQVAEGYVDPRDGKPINANFLPMLADSRLGVLPHTVQHYGINDPAPTYGNTDFRYIYDFMAYEAGRRPTLWFPETAYWVSFDNDVPLFLPIYAERRLSDLRFIAREERNRGKRIDGQLIFSSGWEWGYWLNDVIASAAAWNPHMEAGDDDAFRATIADVFGDDSKALQELLLATAREQHALLIEGRVGGVAPKRVEYRNGQAYMQGFESWDDIASMVQPIPQLNKFKPTQPDKLGLLSSAIGAPSWTEVKPLLLEMRDRFATRAIDWTAWSKTQGESEISRELADGANMNALRAREVFDLYDYARSDLPAASKSLTIKDAIAAIDAAQAVVRRREKDYRMPKEQIAAWRKNPTAYPFTYTWTVSDLYYWKRDAKKAIERPASPCFMNVINPFEIASGEGVPGGLTGTLLTVATALNLFDVRACTSPPVSEPFFSVVAP